MSYLVRDSYIYINSYLFSGLKTLKLTIILNVNEKTGFMKNIYENRVNPFTLSKESS